jgi:lysophospholipase L1-like esterase
VVLPIVINHSWQPEAPVAKSIVDGIRAVLDAVHPRQPRARIVLQTLLPTGEGERNDQVVRPVNREIAALAAEPRYATHVSLLDLRPAFVDPQGRQIAAYFMDGLHPNEAGYRRWRDRLVHHLARERSGASR